MNGLHSDILEHWIETTKTLTYMGNETKTFHTIFIYIQVLSKSQNIYASQKQHSQIDKIYMSH
jgi:hypothetical protein